MDCNIAIIGSFFYHYECIGFLCDILLNNNFIKNKNINVNIYYTQDNFGYLTYFKELYPNIHMFNNNNIEEIKKNNVIIKLTSDDPILYDKNIISVLHLLSNRDISSKFITITPFVTEINPTIPFRHDSEHYLSNTYLNYIFPLYSGITEVNHENIILTIGYFEARYVDADLDEFIKNSIYNFIFIGYGYNNYHGLNKYKNVKTIYDLSTKELLTYIGKSKFILARNHKYMNKDRFSGTLSLAVSHHKPVILSEYFSDIYNLPAITYKNDYSEITNYLNEITDEDYENHKIQLGKFIEKQRDYNKKKFAELINDKISDKDNICTDEDSTADCSLTDQS